MGRGLGCALLLLATACPAAAGTVVLEAAMRGQPGTVSPGGSYELGPPAEHVFVFDLSPVGEPIVSAKLVLPNPPGAFASPQRRETYAVFGVTDAAGHADAGVGARLGAIEVNRSSPASLEIPLDAAILRVLERTNGEVALGGRIETLKRRDGSEHLFADTGPGSGAPPPRLVLETNPAAAPASATTLHVDDDADPESADGSAGAPFASIPVALDLAAPGDVVQVAPGSYDERVFLKPHVALEGAGDASVIDVSLTRPEEGVAVVCADDASLTDFRIVDVAPRGSLGVSGAIDCSNGTSPEIAHNTIEAPDGSSIDLRDSNAWIHHNRLRGGFAGEAGATIFSLGGRPRIEDNEIDSGGVAFIVRSPGAGGISRNLVRGLAQLEGAGENTVANNLFLPDATSGFSLGGLVAWREVEGSFRIVGNTFYATKGIDLDSGDGAVIANNVLVNGSLGLGLQADLDAAEIRHNDVFGNRAGVLGPTTNYVGVDDRTGEDGNLSADPQFVDAFFEDFRLRPTSPALDAGDDEEAVGDTDFDGDARVADGDDDGDEDVDIGAQELQADESLPLPPLPIGVDVLPGRSPNELKFAKVQKGGGKLAVAILSDGAFDAPEEIDVATLILEREPMQRCTEKDVDRDGARDLVCSFPLSGISVRHWPIFVPPACVRGRTLAGRKLLGCDEVEVVR